MSAVYILRHVRELDDDAEEVKLIGVYSSEARAEAAVARRVSHQGFNDYPEGFEIAECEIDDDRFWADGFVIGDGETEGSVG